MNKTRIEWTDATWNPVSGCTRITRGCENCYAERYAERWRGAAGHYYEHGFDLTLRPQQLGRPLRWRKPRMVFAGSMTDLFHKDIPADYLDRIFAVIEQASWHTFQVLTKRASRMRAYLRRRYAGRTPPANLWAGVSVEDLSGRARIRHLRETPAAVRFLSCEPLLGPLALPGEEALDLAGIGWVIAGGESGPKARPMHPGWARGLRDQCRAENIPFFFKQWGEWAPAANGGAANGGAANGGAGEWVRAGRPHTGRWALLDPEGNRRKAAPDGGGCALLFKCGKKAAGRLLDGALHDQWPRAMTAGLDAGAENKLSF